MGIEGKDIEFTSQKEDLKEENEFDHWFMKIGDGLHDICSNPCFNHKGTKTVTGKVLRKVYGEDYQDDDIPNLLYYWDIVKKWYEHPIPLLNGKDSLTNYIPVYSYFYPKPKNEDEEPKPVIFQITEKTSTKEKYLLPEGKGTRSTDIEELIPIDEEDESLEFTWRDTPRGKKLFLVDRYEEDFVKNNPNKIFGYELCDKAIEKYWSIGTLNMNDYIIDNYIA